MVLKRGNNSSGFATTRIIISLNEELEALEKVGRATRQAILDCPVEFSAITILQEIERQEGVLSAQSGQPIKLDPRLPDIDRFIAREIMLKAVAIIAVDRSRQDALDSIRPLRGKPSAKSVREQRRAMRRVRW